MAGSQAWCQAYPPSECVSILYSELSEILSGWFKGEQIKNPDNKAVGKKVSEYKQIGEHNNQ